MFFFLIPSVLKSVYVSCYNRKFENIMVYFLFVQNTIKQIEDFRLHCILEKYLLQPFTYHFWWGKIFF
jgi:hypothetical protein